ncbi:MAG TPA: hypothetical protein VNW54_12315 [Granulicella sp.]|nr:hypothetical protein [Granulicella sp.]
MSSFELLQGGFEVSLREQHRAKRGVRSLSLRSKSNGSSEVAASQAKIVVVRSRDPGAHRGVGGGELDSRWVCGRRGSSLLRVQRASYRRKQETARERRSQAVRSIDSEVGLAMKRKHKRSFGEGLLRLCGGKRNVALAAG